MTGSRDDLIRRAKAGDRFAFDELITPLMVQAFRLACGILLDRTAAEDAVQEAAFRSWRKLGNLRPDTDLRPWFLAIVANQCRDTIRGRWWSVLRFESPPVREFSDVEDRLATGADVRAALRDLPFEQREVLVLRYYGDLAVDEIASIIHIPAGTVKSRISRGLTAMRPHFGLVEALT